MIETNLKAKWTVNLRTGENLNSDMFPDGFLEIPQEKRDQIVAMHLVVGSKKFTINRKVVVDGETHYLDGFFYHILAGRKRIFAEGGIPFIEERFGFCYNSKGDAKAIYFDHMNYWRGLHDKEKKLYKLRTSPSRNEKTEKTINNLRKKAVKYQAQIEFYNDNILEKRVNHALFGRLEDLPEESISLPTVTETVEEAISGN